MMHYTEEQIRNPAFVKSHLRTLKWIAEDWLEQDAEIKRQRDLRRKECTEFASIARVNDSRDTRIVLRDARVKIERLRGQLEAHAENCATWVRSLPNSPDDWTGHPTDAMIIVWTEIERLNESIKRIKFDSGAVEDVSFKVCEAAAVVWELWDNNRQEGWVAQMYDAFDNLRLTAGIKSPPADETHDPDPDGDRLPENDR